jgi:hypothetical protein
VTAPKSFPVEDRIRVDEEFLRGERTITESDLEGRLESVDAEMDAESIRSVLDEIVDGEREFEKRYLIDAEVAPVVHANLDLTRSQAADPGIWHWMATIWHPEFVRHRWPWDEPERTVKSMREKFLGAGTDIYSNAFGRLWWMAELSRLPEADDPYRVTREALEVQTLANRLFDPEFARYRPAVVAFGERLIDENTDVVNHANRRFNQALSTIQLESQSREELRDIVDDVVEGVKEDHDV